MNWIDTNTLIAICTCAIGLTQFILWKHIAKVKAYEAEKGKNLATKEDIAGITKEIKSVESKFINETEKLKADLNLLTNIKTGLFSEKRNIIIDLHASLQKWIQAVIYFDSTNLYHNDSIYKSIDIISNLYNDVLIKESMFKIYIENDKLRSYIYDINKNGLNCMSLKTKLYFELISINDEIQQLKKTEKNEGIIILSNKRKDILNKYYSETPQSVDELFKIIAYFEDQCRIYIASSI